MKNENSQENFKEDPNEYLDESLIVFLKQNKPIAPPPASNFEQQLFTEISKYPQKSPLFTNLFTKNSANLRRGWLWALLIPAAIATGVTFNWVNNRSQLQISSIPELNQMSEVDQAAIEQSLISSWNITDDVVLQTTNTATTSTDTQLLLELSPLEYE